MEEAEIVESAHLSRACLSTWSFVGLIYFATGQKKPKILVNGYDFLLLKEQLNSTTWICSCYYHPKVERCKVRIMTTKGVAYMQGRHNHAPRSEERDYTRMASRRVKFIHQ